VLWFFYGLPLVFGLRVLSFKWPCMLLVVIVSHMFLFRWHVLISEYRLQLSNSLHHREHKPLLHPLSVLCPPLLPLLRE
jgi:hypothetical protein